MYLAYHISFYLGLAVESFMCYQILATKSLKVESDRVYQEIQTGDIARARKAVSMIVGRDTQNLTIEGVTKAAVETVAENTSDGVIAPMFYMAIGGALLGFGCIRLSIPWIPWWPIRMTDIGILDRMPAYLDDVANYIPARLAGLLMIAGIFPDSSGLVLMHGRFSRETDIIMPVPILHRQRQLWQEHWMCSLPETPGILESLCKKPTIGDAIRPIEPEDIRRDLTHYCI